MANVNLDIFLEILSDRKDTHTQHNNTSSLQTQISVISYEWPNIDMNFDNFIVENVKHKRF